MCGPKVARVTQPQPLIAQGMCSHNPHQSVALMHQRIYPQKQRVMQPLFASLIRGPEMAGVTGQRCVAMHLSKGTVPHWFYQTSLAPQARFSCPTQVSKRVWEHEDLVGSRLIDIQFSTDCTSDLACARFAFLIGTFTRTIVLGTALNIVPPFSRLCADSDGGTASPGSASPVLNTLARMLAKVPPPDSPGRAAEGGERCSNLKVPAAVGQLPGGRG